MSDGCGGLGMAGSAPALDRCEVKADIEGVERATKRRVLREAWRLSAHVAARTRFVHDERSLHEAWPPSFGDRLETLNHYTGAGRTGAVPFKQ